MSTSHSGVSRDDLAGGSHKLALAGRTCRVMSLDRDIGRLSEAVENIEASIADIKTMLAPLVEERQQRQGMVKLAGWLNIAIASVISTAAAVGISFTFKG